MANWIKSFLEINPDRASWPVVKRARHSIHLQRPDGQIEANFTEAPCHFQDILGEWHELDTKLVAIGSEYGAPGLKTRISLDGTVRIEGGTYSHRSTKVGIFNATTKSFTAVRTIPLGTVQDDKLVAENDVFKRVLTLTETGLREEIIISSLPLGLPTQADRWVVLETAITGKTFPDGWLSEFNADEFQFPLPRAFNANRNEAECKRYARTVGGVQYVYTGVPVSWLASAVYPVTIDPDFTAGATGYISSAANTTYSTSRNTSASYLMGADFYLQNHWESGNYYTVRRGYLKFDTSSIPDAASVTQVNLTMTVLADDSATDFDVQIVKQDWSEWAADYTNATNRETAYDQCINGAYPADSSTWRNTAGISINTPYTSGNLSTAYVNVTGITYYSLRSSTDYAGTQPTTAQQIYLAGQAHSTPSYRPILTVVYTTGGATGNFLMLF